MEIDINELLAKAEANQNEKLAHAGVPGMKWGVRRWQNEDGSYTPEGRIHYGLNPKYADKSSEDMRKEIEYKRTRDSYIANRTAETRKKRDDLTGLGKSIVKFGANSVNAGYTVKKDLNERNDKQLDRETALNTGLIAEYNAKAKDTSLSDAERAEYADQGVTLVNRNKEIEGIKGEHAKFKEEAKATEKEVKSINSLVDKSDIIEGAASLKTKRQLEREVAEASEAADEMSYEEMKKLVDRMNLEKQYDDMVNPKQPSKAEKLKKAVDNIDHWLALGLTVLAVEKALKERREKRAASHDAFDDSEYLEHYGVKGQKWGVLRYTNEDGTLNTEGLKRYGEAKDPSSIAIGSADQKVLQKQTKKVLKDYEKGAEKLRNKYWRASNKAADLDKKNEERRLKLEDKYGTAENDKKYLKNKSKIEKLDVRSEELAKTIEKGTDVTRSIVKQYIGKKLYDSNDPIRKGKEAIASLTKARDTLAVSDEQRKEYDKEIKGQTELLDLNEKGLTGNRWRIPERYVRVAINDAKTVDDVEGSEREKRVRWQRYQWNPKWGWMKHENDDSEYLEHVGVKGMKKGVRRYQNEDGSLTAEGYRHYGIDPNWNPQAQETPAAKEKRVRKEIEANYRTELLRAKYETKAERYRNKEVERQIKRENKITQDAQRRELQMQNEAKAQNRKDIRKNVMKALVGSAVVGMFVAKGIHSMRMDALMTKNNHELNMLQETGRQEIEKLGISSKSQEKIASINAGKEKYASKQERLAKTAASNATIGVEKEKRKSEIGVEKAKQSGALNVEKAKQEGALNVEKEKQAGAISVEKAKQSGALNVEKEKQAGALDVAKTNADKEKYAADQELKSKVGFRARKLEKIKQEGSLNVEKEKQAGAVSVEKEKQSGALNVAKENAQKEIEINKATNASNLERDNAKHGHEKETNAANRTHELERDRLKNEHEAAMEKAKREHQDATNEANRAHELERDKRAKDHENETNAANRAHELERDRQKNDFELARDKAKASSELKQLKEKNRSNLEIEKEKGMQRALKDDPRQVVEKLTEEKDEAVKKITKEKDEAVKKIIKEKDSAVKEKDNAVKEKDNAVKEKDNAVAELERMRTYVQSLLARGNK